MSAYRSAQRVCVAPNRYRQPCSAAKRLADRAPIEPPPMSQPARCHVGRFVGSSTGPTLLQRGRGWPGRPGATTRRDSPSTIIGLPNPGRRHADPPLPARLVRRPPCDRGSRLPGRPASKTPRSLTWMARPAAPPAIVAHDSPAARRASRRPPSPGAAGGTDGRRFHRDRAARDGCRPPG